MGSEFESPQLDNPGHLSNWLPFGAVTLTAGRQALRLVALELAASEVRELVFADHYCDSMIDPFKGQGLTAIPVRTAHDTLFEPHSLAEELEHRPNAAILFSETFGSTASSPLVGVLDAARATGHAVIVDRTHSLFAQSSYRGDYQIASLRKLLPLSDGAFVTGLTRRPTLASFDPASLFVSTRTQAAREKLDYLEGKSDDRSYLEMFRFAEVSLEQLPDSTPMSVSGLATLDQLDPHRITSARRANAEFLARRMEDLGVLVVNSLGWRTSPSYLVISTPDVASLRQYLSSRGIFCPIHWPVPRGRSGSTSWRSDLLSLVIDQRYDLDDMHRQAAAVAAYLGR